MPKNNIRCYIYTRVSTAIQVDGYSLDAQKDKLRKYADYQNMEIAGEYSDEGASGKNIAERPEFMRMMNDIEDSKDGVSYVLAFKLSRFGRNAADVLSSLQRMQDHDVNLICVEDGIDSSKDAGKLMISVLSAVAEIERENIRAQTMAGREQKAREGRWNGGFAPYGYKLVDGELQIAEDEVDIIRIIFDQYVNKGKGTIAIARYLNDQGYIKKLRQNNSINGFSEVFVRKVLANPVYAGKIAYGRRRTEKKPGTHNEMHIVAQEEYPVYEGKHEAIISEDVWKMPEVSRMKMVNIMQDGSPAYAIHVIPKDLSEDAQRLAEKIYDSLSKCSSLTYLPRFIKIRGSFPKNQGGKVDMQQLAGETDGFIEPAYVKRESL